MKKVLYIFSFLLLSVITISCKKQTLQTYLVEKQDNPKFTTFSLTTDLLPLKNSDNISENDKKAIESIRKINISFLPTKKSSLIELKAEQKKLKKIIEDSGFKKLLSFKKDKARVGVYYIGESDAIDEVIVSLYSKNFGVGVARLLGEDINITKLIQVIKEGNIGLKKDFFDKIKKIK